MDQLYLTDKELQEFGQRLEESRRWLAGELVRIEEQAVHGQVKKAGADGNGTSQPARPAVVGKAWSQLLTMRALDGKRALLHEVEQALGRLAAGQYGRCLLDRAAISKEQLEEVPWTRYCSSCASRAQAQMG